MTFITAPAFIMSPVVIEDAPKTIALGAVATGSMNAYEHVMTEVKTRKIEALSIDYSIMLLIKEMTNHTGPAAKLTQSMKISVFGFSCKNIISYFLT